LEKREDPFAKQKTGGWTEGCLESRETDNIGWKVNFILKGRRGYSSLIEEGENRKLVVWPRLKEKKLEDNLRGPYKKTAI